MKKAMAFILLVILLIDLTSCHTFWNITGRENYEKYQERKGVYVMNLQTNRDSTIYFSKEFPGRISNDGVIGLRHVLLNEFKNDSITYEGSGKNRKVTYVYNNGVSYEIIEQDGNNLVCTSDTTRVLLSDIKQMRLRKIDPLITVMMVSAVGGIVVLIVVIFTFSLNLSMTS